MSITKDGEDTWKTINGQSTPTTVNTSYKAGTVRTNIMTSPFYSDERPDSVFTEDNGTTWTSIDSTGYNAVAFEGTDIRWAGSISMATQRLQYSRKGTVHSCI